MEDDEREIPYGYIPQSAEKKISAARERILGKNQSQKAKPLKHIVKQEEEKSPRKQKLVIPLESSDLGAEKGMAYSLLQSGLGLVEREIEMGHKVWQIGDCIVRKIVDEHGVIFSKEEREAFYMRTEELLKLEKRLSEYSRQDPKGYAQMVPQVEITDFEIRGMLGIRITNSEIYRRVKEFVGTVVDRKSPIIKVDDDRWVRFGTLDNMCRVNYLETGKYSVRNQHPEHAYRFIFDKAASIDFWNSVRLGLFDRRPPSYYRLKAGSQLVLRALGWTDRPSTIKLDQLCRIASVKTLNKTWRQKTVEGYLSELKCSGFIQDWKKKHRQKGPGKKSEIQYTIYKNKYLPSH